MSIARGIKIIFSIMLIAILIGCDDGCIEETTRCNGKRVEICNTDNNWELEVNCSDIEDFGKGIEWTCCEDPKDGLYACLPVDECFSKGVD